jgi:hypothetical protein
VGLVDAVSAPTLSLTPLRRALCPRARAAGCRSARARAPPLRPQVLVELRRRGIQAFSIAQGGVVSRDLGWGSQAFKKAQQVKVQMFADVLAHGYDALLADIDAVFVRDPLPYLGCYPEADMLVSSDHLHNSTTDGGLELATSAHATMNVGMIYARARPGALAFMQEWARRCSANLDFWEQAIFNEMAKDKGGLDVLNATLAPRRLFSLWGRKLVGGILPVSLFCSGHTAFVQAMHAQLGFAVPYAYHATFQYSGTRGKRARLREAGVWIDEPSYYDPAGGLLRFTPRLDARLTRAPWVGVSDTARHLALVATQMAAFRDALALARALGRTLLMSPLTCGYDRYWSGMPDGKIPGSALQLPIRPCPMDHLFELERFPEPDTLFREWSLLDNERTPAAVKTSISVASLAELPQGRELRAALTAAGADLGSKCARARGPPALAPATAIIARSLAHSLARVRARVCVQGARHASGAALQRTLRPGGRGEAARLRDDGQEDARRLLLQPQGRAAHRLPDAARQQIRSRRTAADGAAGDTTSAQRAGLERCGRSILIILAETRVGWLLSIAGDGIHERGRALGRF